MVKAKTKKKVKGRPKKVVKGKPKKVVKGKPKKVVKVKAKKVAKVRPKKVTAKRGLRIPRRDNLRLSKGQAKDMALEMVANALEGTFASSTVEGFTVRMIREKKRPPTEGERNLFLGEISKIVEGIRSRAKGRA